MAKVHPPIFEPYIGTSSEELEPDPSMLTPVCSPKMDPSKPTFPFVFPSNSLAVSSTMGSRVSRREHGHGFIRTCAIPYGHGRGHGHRRRDAYVGWGNGFISSQDQGVVGCHS